MKKHALIIPKNYKPGLNLIDTEKAIKDIKDYFQTHFAKALGLKRVSAPLIVLKKTGLNDNLNGVERPVGFMLKETHEKGEIVQSLAKWKRKALFDYGFKPGEGLYTDMNAIRPDEDLDNLHSIYVDQWDWEIAINRSDRNVAFLKKIVEKIYGAIRNTEAMVCKNHPRLAKPFLPKSIHFIHSEDLLKKYPHLPPRQREDAICKEKGAAFIIGIGSKLKDGKPHDGRAADYDDWITKTSQGKRGLNGDILVWYPVLGRSFELSSMGIRVDEKSLQAQLKLKGETFKMHLDFHKSLIEGKLPLSIGGGIGQSRLCMFFLRKAHVGEVQSSIWPDAVIAKCKRHNIRLL